MRPFGSLKSVRKKLKPSEISRLVLLRNSSVSAGAVRLLKDIEVVMFAKMRPVATIFSIGKLPETFELNLKLHRLSKRKRKKLAYAFAKGACQGKINVLVSMNIRRKNSIIKRKIEIMRSLSRKLIECKTLDELRAIEGNVARNFYEALSQIRGDFIGRYKRYAADIVNVSFNAMHSALYSRIYTRLLCHGIDPTKGFLHQRMTRPKDQTLVWDFSEFWKPRCAWLCLYAINKRIIKEGYLISPKTGGAGKWMNPYGWRKVYKLLDRISDKKIDSKIAEFKEYVFGTRRRFSWKL